MQLHDSQGQRLYLTEDFADGNFYRVTPESYPELEGTGKGPRHLRVRYGHPLDEELLEMRRGLRLRVRRRCSSNST